jgi:methyl-accepting chemotaxis protein
MPLSVLNNPFLFSEGITYSGFKHLGVTGKNNRKIIVSSEEMTPSGLYSNFSFLFLVLVVTIICVMLLYSVRYGFTRMNVSLATKIQIYLNVAFLLPLILVVGITLSIIGTKLAESQSQSYLSQTENVSISVWPAVDKYAQGKMSEEFLSDTLTKIVSNSKKFVSIFDTTGKLLATNKNLIYRTNMVSKFLNPLAYIKLMEEKELKVSLSEQLGNLTFTTSFLGIRSNEGRLLGIISIPFYDAKVWYEKEVSAVIGSLLNAFTTIFVILLLLSFFASNALTVPLRIITNKLRKIDLSKTNEALSWRSDDEIGVLIKAYNQMLVKLEESKIALSDSISSQLGNKWQNR